MRDIKVIRILQAPLDIAGQASLLGKALRQEGFRVEMAFYGQNPFTENTEGVIGTGNKARLALHLIQLGMRALSIDLFHFHAGLTLLAGRSTADLNVLRFLGKRFVFHYHGCEIRYRSKAISLGIPMCETCQLPCSDRKQQRWERVHRYADGEIVTTPDLLQFAPGAKFIPQVVPIPVLKEHGEETHSTSRKLRVLHAPSDPSLKGTSLILPVLEKLQSESILEYQFLQNRPHRDVLSALKNADLAIDWLIFGWYGVFACEAMARGIPVIGWINPKYADFQPTLPIISTEPGNLENTLRQLAANPQVLSEIGSRSREFAIAQHSPRSVLDKVIEVYRSALI